MIKGLINRLKGLRSIELNELPSQNYFYQDDFSIKIKKPDISEINRFKSLYDSTNFVLSMSLVKDMVAKNTVFPKKYSSEDIVNCDVVYLFIEIVKYKRGADINIQFSKSDSVEYIPFDAKHFNYFKVPGNLMKNYDMNEKRFIVNNIKYRFPTNYTQNRVLDFLSSDNKANDSDYYNNADYNFMYFIDDNMATNEDVENMIWLYNDGMEDTMVKEIDNNVKILSGFGTYSLINNYGELVNLNNLDLSSIWDISL